MNLRDSFAQSGFWVSICQVGWSCSRSFSGEVFVHFNSATQMFFKHFRRWVSESSPDVWKLFQVFLPRINAHDVSGISALISYDRNTPLKELCGLIGWKSFSYSSAIIFETCRPIRNSRTSLWWPHGRLSCNLVSYLLITRHLHQCRFNFGSLSMAGGNIRIV